MKVKELVEELSKRHIQDHDVFIGHGIWLTEITDIDQRFEKNYTYPKIVLNIKEIEPLFSIKS